MSDAPYTDRAKSLLGRYSHGELAELVAALELRINHLEASLSDEEINILYAPNQGHWVVTDESTRPNWLHRKMARLFFGWRWVDDPTK